MEEKQRRRQIIVMYNEGYTQGQIARKLSVSEKTVSRDWHKLRGYLERLKWKQKVRIDEILHESKERAPMEMRFRLLGAMICADRNSQWRFMEAVLRGDIAKLRLMLLRRSNE
jgi:DNA-binding transcriptional regulator LsrR (DeoR family)